MKPTKQLVYKLKLIAIVINLLTSNLLLIDTKVSMEVIRKLVSCFKESNLRSLDVKGMLQGKIAEDMKTERKIALQLGLTLLAECVLVF